MKAFSALLDRLAYTPSRNDKLRLLADYFASTPDPDRGWALAALTDGLFFRLPLRRILGEMIEARVDPVLFGLSRDYVGDTAETIALIWPGGDASEPAPRLDHVVQTLKRAMPTEVPGLLSSWLDGLDATERWALLKLVDRRAPRRRLGAARQDRARRDGPGAACRDRGGLARACVRPTPSCSPGCPARVHAPSRDDGDLQAADAVASDRGPGARRDRAEGLRGRMEMGRHPRAGGAPRRRAAALLAHRRRHLAAPFPMWSRRCRPGVVLDGELLVMRGDEVGAVQRSAAAAEPQDRHACHAEIASGRISASTTCCCTARRICAPALRRAPRAGSKPGMPRRDRRAPTSRPMLDVRSIGRARDAMGDGARRPASKA